MLRRSWDSDACLAFLKNEPGTSDACQRVLEAAERGALEIAVSSLVLAEVLWVTGKEQLPETSRTKVRQFFKHQYILVVDLTRAIAESAQEIVWKYPVHPKDAIHVATALYAAADELNSFDRGLLALDGKVGQSPGLRIRRPDWEKQEELPLEPSPAPESPSEEDDGN